MRSDTGEEAGKVVHANAIGLPEGFSDAVLEAELNFKCDKFVCLVSELPEGGEEKKVAFRFLAENFEAIFLEDVHPANYFNELKNLLKQFPGSTIELSPVITKHLQPLVLKSQKPTEMLGLIAARFREHNQLLFKLVIANFLEFVSGFNKYDLNRELSELSRALPSHSSVFLQLNKMVSSYFDQHPGANVNWEKIDFHGANSGCLAKHAAELPVLFHTLSDSQLEKVDQLLEGDLCANAVHIAIAQEIFAPKSVADILDERLPFDQRLYTKLESGLYLLGNRYPEPNVLTDAASQTLFGGSSGLGASGSGGAAGAAASAGAGADAAASSGSLSA